MKKPLSKHFSFIMSPTIASICTPLADIFGANFFIYQRSLLDAQITCVNSNALLCNNGEALEFILSLPPKKRETAKYDNTNSGRKYVLMETTQPQFTAILRNKFNFNNIFCRDEQISKNEWEHFIIGTCSNDPKMINCYLNNIEIIDKFAAYFRSRAAKLIDKACEDRFVSGRAVEQCDFRSLNNLTTDHSLENFSKQLDDLKHYYIINSSNENIAIPRAEMRCLIKLSQGRTSKEIGKTFDISSRTVETYINLAKIGRAHV
jgi:hypothetical protein